MTVRRRRSLPLRLLIAVLGRPLGWVFDQLVKGGWGH